MKPRLTAVDLSVMHAKREWIVNGTKTAAAGNARPKIDSSVYPPIARVNPAVQIRFVQDVPLALLANTTGNVKPTTVRMAFAIRQIVNVSVLL